MANIQVPVISLTNTINHLYNIFNANGSGFVTYATGVSTVNGTPEIFEIEFPSVNESCYIYIANKNISSVQARVLSGNDQSGFSPSNFIVSKNAMAILAFNPFYVQNAEGKIQIRVTPNAMNTVAKCGIQLVGIYSSDTSTSISAPFQLVDAEQLSSGLFGIADAIRARGGTSATLNFPAGFISAVNELSTVSDTPITMTPSLIVQHVQIPSGFDGVSDVTVEAIQLDSNNTATDNGRYPAATGKYFQQFIVNIPEYNGSYTVQQNNN